MSKFYKQALSMISSGEFDSQKLALRLAQEHPALFVKLLTPEVVQPDVPGWFIESVVRIAEHTPIQAIKNLREKANLGLFDAKHIVDHIRDLVYADPVVIDRKIGHEIPEFAGKTWADLVKAAKAI